MINKNILLILISPAILILCGCGNLAEIKAVQKFAEIQAKSANVFQKIANDSYQTCIRSANYITLNTPPKSVDEDRTGRERECNDPVTGSIAVKNSFQKTHKVINDYLVALGQLSNDRVTNFSPEVQAVGSAIQTLPGLGDGEKKEAIQAGTSLADFLLRIFTNGYRRNKLKEVIITTDPYLTKLVIALNISVKKHYLNGLLSTERESLDGYYSKSLGFVLTQPEGQNVALQEYISKELNSKWLEKQEIIREKRELASEYLDLLKEIACDHSNLKTIFMDIKKEKEAKTTCDQSPDLKQLFTRRDILSPVVANQLLEGYSRKVTVLHEKAEKLFSKN
jgi:hypothetical protein